MSPSEKQRTGVVVLGSTGSVGGSTLDVLDALQDRFSVVGLAAGQSHAKLQQQIDRFQPRYASLVSDTRYSLQGARVVDSDDPLVELATLECAEIVVVATTGHAAIRATLAALRAGKIVALANKETIVAAGEIVMHEASQGPGELRPVDSEHSAIWQCLEGCQERRSLERIILTASGGPFRGWTTEQLGSVAVLDALNHPNWSMGAKITVDSATLMNKGFELIETSWLFDCSYSQIEVLIHPQSIVHSMVEFRDGTFIAQLASHDMRIPIQYALTYPDRLPGPGDRLSLLELKSLVFDQPDLETFPLLNLARRAGEAGATYPAVLSCADSLAVSAFMDGKISYLDIQDIVERTVNAHAPEGAPLTLDAIAEADRWATEYAGKLIKNRAIR